MASTANSMRDPDLNFATPYGFANPLHRLRVGSAMDAILLIPLVAKFSRLGARHKVADRPATHFDSDFAVTLDVRAKRQGKFSEILRRPDTEAEVAALDVQSTERHRLLMVRDGADKSKFLCGHDERHRT